MQQVIDLVNLPTKGQSLKPQSVTGAVTGDALDLWNGTGPLNAIINVGAVVALTSFDVIIEDSTTSGGTYATVMSTTITAGNQLLALQGLNASRYARARVANVSMTSALLAVSLIQQSKYGAPTTSGASTSPA